MSTNIQCLPIYQQVIEAEVGKVVDNKLELRKGVNFFDIQDWSKKAVHKIVGLAFNEKEDLIYKFDDKNLEQKGDVYAKDIFILEEMYKNAINEESTIANVFTRSLPCIEDKTKKEIFYGDDKLYNAMQIFLDGKNGVKNKINFLIRYKDRFDKHKNEKFKEFYEKNKSSLKVKYINDSTIIPPCMRELRFITIGNSYKIVDEGYNTVINPNSQNTYDFCLESSQSQTKEIINSTVSDFLSTAFDEFFNSSKHSQKLFK